MTKKYDSAISDGLLLDLALDEGFGNPMDSAKPHHPMTMSGTPTWASLANGTGYLDFNSGHPDYVQCAAASCADLNFTTGAFSVAFWIYKDTTDVPLIICRGTTNVNGWYIEQLNTGFVFVTNGPGFVESRTEGYLSANVWGFGVAVRNGSSARLYVNGIDTTTTAGVHTNPITCPTNLYIGVYTGILLPFDGKLASARIWNRALSAAEIYYLFNRERHYFGV